MCPPTESARTVAHPRSRALVVLLEQRTKANSISLRCNGFNPKSRYSDIAMVDRRDEVRMLCADMVSIQWKDKSGRDKNMVANLEDISLSGACLQLDLPIPLHTLIKISYQNGNAEETGLGRLEGVVHYCVYREIGYFVGVRFGEGFRWSQKEFKPLHLVDPRRLAIRGSKIEGDPGTKR